MLAKRINNFINKNFDTIKRGVSTAAAKPGMFSGLVSNFKNLYLGTNRFGLNLGRGINPNAVAFKANRMGLNVEELEEIKSRSLFLQVMRQELKGITLDQKKKLCSDPAFVKHSTFLHENEVEGVVCYINFQRYVVPDFNFNLAFKHPQYFRVWRVNNRYFSTTLTHDANLNQSKKYLHSSGSKKKLCILQDIRYRYYG